jgi:predicted nucleic acid-binding protein
LICVDSSIAIKWFVEEPDSAVAFALLNDTLARNEGIVVPVLFFSEVANVLRQRVRGNRLMLQLATTHMDHLITFPFRVESRLSVCVEALALADHYNLPAAYDAHYLAVARQHHADLWTADARFIKALRSEAAFVHDLSTYPQYGGPGPARP